MRLLTALRIGYGSTLLLAPRKVTGDLPHRRVDTAARVATRLLGARQLAEAALVGEHHSRGWILLAAGVDATHSASMVVLGAARPERRLLASASALAAGTMAAAGVAQACRPHGVGAGSAGSQPGASSTT